jgi:hypothetical protein
MPIVAAADVDSLIGYWAALVAPSTRGAPSLVAASAVGLIVSFGLNPYVVYAGHLGARCS